MRINKVIILLLGMIFFVGTCVADSGFSILPQIWGQMSVTQSFRSYDDIWIDFGFPEFSKDPVGWIERFIKCVPYDSIQNISREDWLKYLPEDFSNIMRENRLNKDLLRKSEKLDISSSDGKTFLFLLSFSTIWSDSILKPIGVKLFAAKTDEERAILLDFLFHQKDVWYVKDIENVVKKMANEMLDSWGIDDASRPILREKIEGIKFRQGNTFPSKGTFFISPSIGDNLAGEFDIDVMKNRIIAYLAYEFLEKKHMSLYREKDTFNGVPIGVLFAYSFAADKGNGGLLRSQQEEDIPICKHSRLQLEAIQKAAGDKFDWETVWQTIDASITEVGPKYEDVVKAVYEKFGVTDLISQVISVKENLGARLSVPKGWEWEIWKKADNS